jgi:hypothetical protein
MSDNLESDFEGRILNTLTILNEGMTSELLAMNENQLREQLIFARIEIEYLKSVIASTKEKRRQGGRLKGIDRKTGENKYAVQRELALVWMLQRFVTSKNHTYAALSRKFQQKECPFSENALREVWREYKKTDKEIKEDLLAFVNNYRSR